MKVKKHYFMLVLMLFGFAITFAQEKMISGRILDASGLPLPGASVLVKGTTAGTSSDFDGNYSIKANQGATLVFSFVGYTTKQMVVGQSNSINVTLSEDASALEEVLVVAYGTTTKAAFTGSASVINSADLGLRTVTSPIAALEGKATGVQILSANGQPGSSPGIVIRGVGTLNGSTDPLYVVDGIQFEGALNTISQEDVESITVLKDAASTALYGSRGANGVILITTKKGNKNGAITVNASTQYSFVTRGLQPYDAVSPGQYYELMWEAYKNTAAVQGTANPGVTASESIYNRLGYNPFNVPNNQIVGTDGVLNPNAELIYKSLDWNGALEQTGSRTNHSVNVSGGGDKHQVFFSANYLEEEGYVITSDFERINTRLNVDFQPTDWLSLGGSVNTSISESNSVGGSGEASIVNPFGWALNIAPIYPVYVNDLNGNIVLDAAGNPEFDLGTGYPEYNIQNRPFSSLRHGVAELLYNDELNRNNTYGFRYYGQFQLLEGLKLSLNYGQDINDGINKSYENNIVGDGAPSGRYGETRFRRNTSNFNQILTYNKTFNETHNFDLTLGHESFERNYSENNGLSTTQTATGIFEFDNFAVPVRLGGASTEKTVEGYFARLNYNFANKYYISASARRDASSVFSAEARWGNFYSVGASWRIDQEKFMDNVSFVNSLKLRGSYGEVGNDDLGDFFISQPRYSLTSNAGDPAILWTNLGNNELTWETVESFDVALEFGLFDYALEGTFEYYKRNSTELLYNVPLPLSNGLDVGPANIGDMYNSGLELALTAHFFKSRDFKWDLTLQASTFKNEITFIPDPFVSGTKRWEIGRSRFDFYIFDYAGVDPSNGDALYNMYEDGIGELEGQRVPVLNADGTQSTTNDWDDAGRVYTGDNTVPDVLGSVSNTFSYKGFSLDVLFTYGIGGEFLDFGYASLMHTGTYGRALHPDALRAWRAPGDITDVPRLETGNINQVQTQSTRFLTDASFLTLRNVNLGYTFNKQLSEMMGVNTFRLYASGENLFVKSKRTGLDPQFNLAGTPGGNAYNPARIVSLGLNVSF
jgi:TonB-linked SusC/RagA family outer membrane protein